MTTGRINQVDIVPPSIRQASIHRTYPEAASEHRTSHRNSGSAHSFATVYRRAAEKAVPHNRELPHEFHFAGTMLAYAITQQPQTEGTQLEAAFKELQVDLFTK